MTVADAFTLAINALMQERGWNQSDVMRKTGLSSPQVSRMASPKSTQRRGASFPTLELLRVGFDVTAADLFTPRVVDVHGRVIDTGQGSAHTLATSTVDRVGSAPLTALLGGATVDAPDYDLLEMLVKNWWTMTPEARTELFLHSRRLKGPGAASAVGSTRR